MAEILAGVCGIWALLGLAGLLYFRQEIGNAMQNPEENNVERK